MKRRSMEKAISTIIVFVMVFASLSNGFSKNTQAAINSKELASTYLSATVKYLNFGQKDTTTYDFNINKEAQEKGAVYSWYVKEDKGNQGVVTINSKTGVVTAKKAGTAYIRCKVTLADDTILRPEAKVIVRNNITEVDISNMPKGQTITAGEIMDFNRAIINTDAGKGIKSMGITRWEIRDDTAGVDKISDGGIVTPLHKGLFSVRAVSFQSKEKYGLWLEDKEVNKNYITASSKWYTITVVDAKGTITVATQEELNKALTATDNTQITITTENEIKFTIAAGDYLNKTLIVDAPNADIDNFAKFKNIIIRAIKENTWNENADGNTFQVTSIKVRIIVNGNAEIKEIIFDRQNSVINLVIEGIVHQITILQPSELNLSGDGEQIPITIEKTGDGSKITTSIPLNLECDQNSEIVLNHGAEGTTINKSDSTVEVKVENNSDQSVVVTTDNTGGQTIEAGESGVSNGTAQPTLSPISYPPTGGGTPIVPTLNSIAIKAPATKTVYLIGETLDLTGLVIEGTYSNSSKNDVTITAANVTGFNSTAVAASQTLTVTVSGKTATYTVVINPILVNTINVTGAGSSTTVVNGESLLMHAAITPVNATNQTISWSVSTLAGGTATIDTSTALLVATGVGTVTVTATNSDSGVVGSLVVAIEPTLAVAKVTAKDALASALLTYTEGNYTAGNWTTLTTAKTNGDTAINAALDLTGVGTAKTTALGAMDAVKTIAETEADAVAEINDTDAAGMPAAITTNAVTLGLSLTDYNALSNNSAVITAMVMLSGANKATIVSTFNTAVAIQKTADVLAAAKVTAKGELETVLLTYTVGNYSTGNWTTLIAAKTNGDTAIEDAIDLTGVGTAKAMALAAMDAVKTIEETAVAAINDADVSGMPAAITANAVTLGLNLTDYNALTYNSTVITAMVALSGADKATIVSTFNTAVAAQKAAETLATAKADAKDALATALLTYIEGNYTSGNWTTLTTAKTNGDSAIEASSNLVDVGNAKTTALVAMDAVKTIVETIAEAEAAAVAAINNADAAGMPVTISSNATTLGLILTDYNALTNKSTVITAMVALSGADKATIVSTFNTAVAIQKAAEDLAAEKVEAKGDLAAVLLTYTEGNYTAGNWTTLTTAKTNGDTAIDAASDLTGVGTAKATAIAAMDAVKTMAETAAEAEAAAVAAINNADAAGMPTAIAANAVTLGLSLTDYNALTNNSTVITAMVALTGADKATIVSTFNAAVAIQKTADILAAAKVTAKGDLETVLLTYTEGNYTAGNWTTLTTAKANGDTAIEEAIDLTGVGTAKTTALDAMDAVKTIEETAVAAINDADASGMPAAITANAVTLGLNLTDYNALSNNSTVINAMAALSGADKATIVSTFNTAVATQKAAETLATAKVNAKDDLADALLTYIEGNYTTGNWTTLTTAKTNGDTAIDAALSLANVGNAKTTALEAMDAVKTIEETEAAAVAAINAANAAGMATAITANAATLGLVLTDYSALTNKTPVQTALIGKNFTGKAGVKTAFDTAVSAQKLAEATIIGYYLNVSDTALVTTSTVAYGTVKATALSALSVAGYAKLSDNSYVPITIVWDFNETYDIATAGVKLVTGTVTGTFAGGQVPTNIVGSVIVELGDGPAAPPAPTLATKTATSVTLIANSLHEFSIDGGSNWQDSNLFEELDPAFEYYFVARIKETLTHKASNSSAATTIATNPMLVTGITVTSEEGNLIVVNGYSLQMSAAILPVNATDSSVSWSVVSIGPLYGTATIDEFGNLTGTKIGEIQVVATANDGSGKKGSMYIDVTKDYEIGDLGEAGGRVFYDKGFYSDGWRYLEAAPADGTYTKWSNVTSTLVGTQTAIGTGQANTTAIVGQAGHYNSAAKICNDYNMTNTSTFVSYNDWFLPSLDELNLMKTNLYLASPSLGGFTTDRFYWSSSEDFGVSAATGALGMLVNSTYNYYLKNYGSGYVRAIRSF